MSAGAVVYPSYAELLHQVRRLRADNDSLRYALDERVQAIGDDVEKAERAQSRLYFHAWREGQRQLRVLRDEIARLKEPTRG